MIVFGKCQHELYSNINQFSRLLVIIFLSLFVSSGYAGAGVVVTQNGLFKDSFVIRLKTSDSTYNAYNLKLMTLDEGTVGGEIVSISYSDSDSLPESDTSVKTPEKYHQWITAFINATGRVSKKSHVFAALMVLPLVNVCVVPSLNKNFSLSGGDTGGAEGFKICGLSEAGGSVSATVMFCCVENDLNVTVIVRSTSRQQDSVIHFAVMDPFVKETTNLQQETELQEELDG